MERIPFRKIRTGIPAVLFLVLLAGVIFGSEPVFAVGPLSSGHVVIFVLENKGFRDIIGNPDAPFINRLAESNVLLTDYHAMAHPSLPNYVAMLSGRTDGVHSDNPSLRFSDPTIAESLVRKGYSVKGYFQSLPEKGYLGNAFPPGKPLYVVRHNPFYLFGQIRNDPDWKRRIVPIEDLPDDLRRGRLPALSFVIGDLCHDMHGGGGCPPLGHADLVKAGDRFVAFWVRKIRRSSNWKKERTIIVVTWDEGRYPVLQRIRDGLGRRPVRGGGGRVPFVAISSRNGAPHRYGGYFDHRSLVRSLALFFRVPSPVGSFVKPLPQAIFGKRPEEKPGQAPSSTFEDRKSR